MRTKRHILSVILAIALLALPTTVFAKELGLLTITGPGINGELSVTDNSILMKLMDSGFFDQTSMLKQAPENLGEGYAITSHLNLDGKMTPFIEMVYYPIEKGQPGYVHITGRLDGAALQPADEWSTLSLDADNFFRTVMAANKVTLQSAIVAAPAAVAVEPQTQSEVQPSSIPTAPAAPNQTLYLALALILTVIAAAGAAVMLRRRGVSQHSA